MDPHPTPHRAPDPAAGGASPVELDRVRRIALVGASPDPARPSHGVMAALLDRGFDVVPVNPNADEVLGQRCYPALGEVPAPIDLVDVFRASEHAVEVVHDAIAVGAAGVWLQLGVRSERAAAAAAAADLAFVQDRCLAVEVARLGLRPGEPGGAA